MRTNHLVVLALAAMACGSSDGDPGDGSGHAQSDAGVDGSDGGSNGNQGDDPDLAHAPSYDGYGTVYVALTRIAISGTTYDTTAIGALFYEAVPQNTGNASCTSGTTDGCVVTKCTGTSSGVTPHQPAAGDVTISGPGHSATLHTAYDSNETQSTQTFWWHSGDALAISSTGATVPAFNASLVVPSQIVVSAPYLPAQGSVSITRSLGLSLTWQAAPYGTAEFSLAASAAGTTTSATCSYPASQGSAAMSTSVLSQFPAGPATFSAMTRDTKAQAVGSWYVTSYAYFNAVYDTGRSVGGQLQLE